MNAWLPPGAAIVAKAIGASALKASAGFSRPPSGVAVRLGCGAAFHFPGLALRQIPVGIACAVWSGTGTVLITFIGVFVARQKIDATGVPALNQRSPSGVRG